MKKFEVPTMIIQRLEAEDIFAVSGCNVEAKNCDSCYVSAGECDEGSGYGNCGSQGCDCNNDLSF